MREFGQVSKTIGENLSNDLSHLDCMELEIVR